MLRKTILLIFASLILLIPAVKAVSDSLFENADTYFFPINNNDQIPWGIVTVLQQDSDGFMWVGTQKGLMRFDGYDFIHYLPDADDPNSLVGNWISVLAQPRPNDLWIGTTKGLSIYKKDTGQFINVAEQQKNPGEYVLSNVYAIQNSDLGVWVATSDRLLLIQADSLSIRAFPKPIHDGKEVNVTAIQVIDERKAVLGSSVGLFAMDIVSGESQKIDLQLEDTVSKLNFDSQGTLWVSTVKGLSYVDSQQFSQLETIKSQPVDSGIYRNVVQISDTQIWATKLSDGIHVYDIRTKKKLKHLQRDELVNHSLKSSEIRAIYKDDSGIVWIGQWGDGILLHDTKNQYIKPFSIRSALKSQLENTSVFEIVSSEQSGLWLFGGKKSLNIAPNNRSSIRHWPALDSLVGENNSVYAATRETSTDGSEQLYLLTTNGHVLQFDPQNNTGERLTKKPLICYTSTKIILSKDRKLWLACPPPAKLIRFDLDTRESVEILDGQSQLVGSVSNLDQAPNGDLWLTASNGLFIISETQNDEPGISPVEAFTNIQTIEAAFTTEGDVWIDSFAGLFKGVQNNGTWEFTSLSEQLDLKKEQLFGNMLLDEKGWIWGDEGVLDTQKMKFHRRVKGQGVDTGPNWLGSAAAMNDGTLVFGADNQLITIQPPLYSHPISHASIAITALTVNNKIHHIVPKSLALDIDDKNFSVDIALLDYASPNGHRYRYKLEGYDNDWIYTDAKNRRIRYTNLSAGNYRLKIQGATNQGQWTNKPLILPIQKAASLTETPWFWTLVILPLLAFLWLLHRLKLRYLQEREKQLSILVDERTEELQISLSDLKIAQKKLIDSEKQALLGRLVRGLAHELNTPLSVIKMAESMLGDKITEAARFIADQSESDGEKFYTSTNKTLNLLRDNLEKSVNLVRHFKSVDIEESDDEVQWFSPKVYFEQLMEISALTPNVTGRGDIDIQCQQQALTQVINELLKNAISHGGNDINIAYQLEDNNENQRLRLTVSDHTQGIEPEILEKMFQPFYSSKSGGGSPGLGLYMVENIVRFRLMGNIEVESEIGSHTKFILLIPVSSRLNNEFNESNTSQQTQ